MADATKPEPEEAPSKENGVVDKVCCGEGLDREHERKHEQES